MKTIFCFCSLLMGAICAIDLVMSSGAKQTTGDDATHNSSYLNTSDANSISIWPIWPPEDANWLNIGVDWDSIGVEVKETPKYETSLWKEPEQEMLRTILIPSDAAPGDFIGIDDKDTGGLIVALQVCPDNARNVSDTVGGNATSNGDIEVSPLFNR